MNDTTDVTIGERSAYPSRATELTGSRYTVLSFFVVSVFAHFLLAIVFSVLRFTVCGYIYG